MYKTPSRLCAVLVFLMLTGCQTHMQSSSAPMARSKEPLTLIEPDGTKSIANPDGSIRVIAAPSSAEDLDVGSQTESAQRSDAGIIDNYGQSVEMGSDKNDDFEALPPVSPQDNGCSGMFCP